MDKRLLIVSSDPLSQTYNNGKTLESLIHGWEKKSIAQFYTNPVLPSSTSCEYFFRITDQDLFLRIGHIKTIGQKIYNEPGSASVFQESFIRSILKKSQTIRFLRELLWKHNWDHCRTLNSWLDDFNPQVILFLGGDGLFLYHICSYIADKYSIPIIFQVTDDYLDRSVGLSLFGLIRKKQLTKVFSAMVYKSKKLISIGDTMRIAYNERFGIDSVILMNCVTIPYDTPTFKYENTNAKCSFLYAGSLYYGREKILIRLAQVLDQMKQNGLNVHLEIYTSSLLSRKAKKYFKNSNSVSLCGYVTSEVLKRKMANTDILVFVEDFSRKNISNTRLSVSTKIPEYMISGKCILGIGPASIGSISYLKDFAYICDDINSTYKLIEIVTYLVTHPAEREKYAKRAYKVASLNHDEKKVRKIFRQVINDN